MKTRIQKHGGGLALFLPKSISDASGLTADVEVEITCENGAVVARPLSHSRMSLNDLVSRITPENRHSETETGCAVGQEAM